MSVKKKRQKRQQRIPAIKNEMTHTDEMMTFGCEMFHLISFLRFGVCVRACVWICFPVYEPYQKDCVAVSPRRQFLQCSSHPKSLGLPQ